MIQATNAKDDNGTTALITASEKCHLEVVHELLKHREVDVNARNDSGATALLVASEHGHVEVVRRLTNRKCYASNQDIESLGDAIDDEGDKDGSIGSWNVFSDIGSGLLTRDQLGMKEVTEGGGSHLPRVGDDGQVDMHAKREDGATALISACCNGHLSVVRELLNHQAMDVNAVDADGATALIVASGNGHLEIVQELLKHANVTSDIENDESSGDLSIASGPDDNVTKVVNCDRTAGVIGKVEPVRLSVSHRQLDLNAKKHDGATALIAAGSNGHLKVVCEMLKLNLVDVNEKTVAGETCLSLAIRHGHADIVSALQKHEHTDKLW